MEGAGAPDEAVAVAVEVHLGQGVEDVEDGGFGDEVGVRAGRAAVRAGAPGEVGPVAQRPVGSQGGVVVAGYTRSYGAGGSDMILVKLSATGDLSWTKH